MNFRGTFSFGFSILSLWLLFSPAAQAARKPAFWTPLEEIKDEATQEDLKDHWIGSQLIPTMTISDLKERISSDRWEWVQFEPVYKPIFKRGKVFSKKVGLQAVFQEVHRKEKGLPIRAVIPVHSCRQFDQILQKATVQSNYGYGKYRVQQSRGTLTYQGRPLYNTILEACNAQMSPETTFMCPNTVEKKNTVVSKVGALITIVSQTEGGSGCGPSFSDMEIQTINLRTGQRLALTDYFQENSLVEALKNGSAFNSAYGALRPQPMKLKDFDFAGAVLGGFTIDALHLTDDKIRVRVALLDTDCGSHCAEDFKWLSLEVKPTKKFLNEYKSLQIQKELYAKD